MLVTGYAKHVVFTPRWWYFGPSQHKNEVPIRTISNAYSLLWFALEPLIWPKYRVQIGLWNNIILQKLATTKLVKSMENWIMISFVIFICHMFFLHIVPGLIYFYMLIFINFPLSKTGLYPVQGTTTWFLIVPKEIVSIVVGSYHHWFCIMWSCQNSLTHRHSGCFLKLFCGSVLVNGDVLCWRGRRWCSHCLKSCSALWGGIQIVSWA